MLVKKKYKKLTNREKEFNRKLREQMRAEGILPPIKPKLNRKKFLEETKKEYAENIMTLCDIQKVIEAIEWLTPTSLLKITSEDVGVIKIMKVAVEIKKFKEEKKNQGELSDNVIELYERIKPIREL